jgi:hypothetical protein
MRWFVILLVFLLIFNRFGVWLERWGLGRLPGDVRFRLFGRTIFIPFASSLLLSLVLLLLGKLV